MTKLANTLKKNIKYAQDAKSYALLNLYYGKIKMAYELQAIDADEFHELSQMCMDLLNDEDWMRHAIDYVQG